MRRFLVAFLVMVAGVWSFAGDKIPLTLEAAISNAMSNSTQIKQMEWELAAATEQLNQGFADLVLPDAAISSSLTVLDPDTVQSGIVDSARVVSNMPVTIPPSTSFNIPVYESYKLTNAFYDNYSVALGLNKALFSGFRLWNSYRLKEIQLEIARIKLEDKRKEIRAGVQTTFYNLFLLQENLRLTRELDRSLKERLDYTRANYQSGMVSDYDVIRADVQYKNNKPKLTKIENAMVTAKLAFCQAIGVDPETMELVGDLLDATNLRMQDISFSNALVLALSNDLNLRVLNRSIESQELVKEISAAGKYPTIAAFFNYKIDYKKLTTTATDRSWVNSWNTGIQLNIPLDDWLPFSKTEASAREAQINIEKSMVTRKILEDNVALQVKTLLLQIQEAEDNSQSQWEAVNQARRGFDIANERYRYGSSSSLEVTDAEVSLQQAQAAYLQTIYDYYSGVIRLNRMIGRD